MAHDKVETRTYIFYKNGTFSYQRHIVDSLNMVGNYKVSNWKITFTNIVSDFNHVNKTKGYPDTVVEYEFIISYSGKEMLLINKLEYPNDNYLPKSGGGEV